MEKNNIFEKIEQLVAAAYKERWPLFYDRLADALYWTKQRISRKAKLVGISREIAFFVNPRGNWEGMLIQPFQSNFLTENKNLRTAAKILEKKEKLQNYDDAEELMIGIAEGIKKEIKRDARKAGYSSKELEAVIEAALTR